MTRSNILNYSTALTQAWSKKYPILKTLFFLFQFYSKELQSYL